MAIDRIPEFNEDDFVEKPAGSKVQSDEKLVARDQHPDLHIDSSRDRRRYHHRRPRSGSPRSRHKSYRRHETETRSRHTERDLRKRQSSPPNPTKLSGNHDTDGSDDDDVGPKLPSPANTASTTIASDARLMHEQDRDQKHLLQSHQRLQDRSDRSKERARRSAILDDLIPKPDPGRPQKLAKNAILSEFHASSPRTEDPTLLDSEMFAEDELKARMQRDLERKLERDKIRKIKELERDQERLGRVEKMREKERSNMEILKRLAEKRFG